jgi:hypothetical protein
MEVKRVILPITEDRELDPCSSYFSSKSVALIDLLDTLNLNLRTKHHKFGL